MIRIAPLAQSERAAWERLARGYNDFYETVLPPSDYDRACWPIARCTGWVPGSTTG